MFVITDHLARFALGYSDRNNSPRTATDKLDNILMIHCAVS